MFSLNEMNLKRSSRIVKRLTIQHFARQIRRTPAILKSPAGEMEANTRPLPRLTRLTRLSRISFSARMGGSS